MDQNKPTFRNLSTFNYCDGPIRGLAEYNGEKVYYACDYLGYFINPEEAPQEIIDIMKNYKQPENLDNDESGSDTIGCTKYYDVLELGLYGKPDLQVFKKRTYNIYRVSDEILKQLELFANGVYWNGTYYPVDHPAYRRAVLLETRKNPTTCVEYLNNMKLDTFECLASFSFNTMASHLYECIF